jgi:hypothetical protein
MFVPVCTPSKGIKQRHLSLKGLKRSCLSTRISNSQ